MPASPDAAGALRAAGLQAEVIPDGSAVLIRADDTGGAGRVLGALDGVGGVRPFPPGVLYAHARPGRAFQTGKPLPRGIHGCPATAPTLCIATGGHPGIAVLPRLLRGAVGLRW